MATRVLLADDHALIRQGLKVLLEKQGFQVVGEASDGQEALRSAEKTQHDEDQYVTESLCAPE
jgi:DNA-binding NarL/FixJ family response regulator